MPSCELLEVLTRAPCKAVYARAASAVLARAPSLLSDILRMPLGAECASRALGALDARLLAAGRTSAHALSAIAQWLAALSGRLEGGGGSAALGGGIPWGAPSSGGTPQQLPPPVSASEMRLASEALGLAALPPMPAPGDMDA